jgi:hypothetical protein
VRACASSCAGISTGGIRSGGGPAAWGGLPPPAGPSGRARREPPTRSGQITCQTRAARSLVNDRRSGHESRAPSHRTSPTRKIPTPTIRGIQ